MTQVRIPQDIYHHPQTSRSCAAKEKLIPMLRKVLEASGDYFFFCRYELQVSRGSNCNQYKHFRAEGTARRSSLLLS